MWQQSRRVQMLDVNTAQHAACHRISSFVKRLHTTVVTNLLCEWPNRGSDQRPHAGGCAIFGLHHAPWHIGLHVLNPTSWLNDAVIPMMHMGSICCNVVVPSACASIARHTCRLPTWACRICDSRTLQADQPRSASLRRATAHPIRAMASESSAAGSAGLAEGLHNGFCDRWVPW